MGYRSQVAIVTRKEITWPKEVERILKESGKVTETDVDKVFYGSYLKWYDNYEDVETVMSWLQGISDMDYAFLRVGEEPGDVEELGSTWEFGLGYRVQICHGSKDLND